MTRVRREESMLLVVDVQERLLSVIADHAEVESRIGVAIHGIGVLGIPLIVTEQYPKGLGPTVESIATRIDASAPIEKQRFSCCGVAPVDRAIADIAPRTIIVVGIETHVCVMQTCLDLLDRGIVPVVLADCVGSRHPRDHEIALARLQASGALVTTLESVLFELTGTAGTDEFKQISRLVKPL